MTSQHIHPTIFIRCRTYCSLKVHLALVSPEQQTQGPTACGHNKQPRDAVIPHDLHTQKRQQQQQQLLLLLQQQHSNSSTATCLARWCCTATLTDRSLIYPDPRKHQRSARRHALMRSICRLRVHCGCAVMCRAHPAVSPHPLRQHACELPPLVSISRHVESVPQPCLKVRR